MNKKFIYKFISYLRVDDYDNKIYSKPYCRIGPYSVGVILAHFYLKNKHQIVINSVSY